MNKDLEELQSIPWYEKERRVGARQEYFEKYIAEFNFTFGDIITYNGKPMTLINLDKK